MNNTKEIDFAEINHEADLTNLDHDSFDDILYNWGLSKEDTDFEVLKESLDKIKEEFGDSTVDYLKALEKYIQLSIELLERTTE